MVTALEQQGKTAQSSRPAQAHRVSFACSTARRVLLLLRLWNAPVDEAVQQVLREKRSPLTVLRRLQGIQQEVESRSYCGRLMQ